MGTQADKSGIARRRLCATLAMGAAAIALAACTSGTMERFGTEAPPPQAEGAPQQPGQIGAVSHGCVPARFRNINVINTGRKA